jgi:hypothetical protein
VGANTSGTRRLRSAYALEPAITAARLKGQARAKAPAIRAKIAASRRGRPSPRHVVEALRAANLGRSLSAETRRKMSEAHRRRGTRPPRAGRPWTVAEDALLTAGLSAVEVAARTRRTLGAVYPTFPR